MILYLDCASGISGDMLVAALLDLVDAVEATDALEEVVRPALVALGVDPRIIAAERVRRGGVAARAFTVAERPGFGTFAELRAAVSSAPLTAAVGSHVLAVAARLAGAEAEVHGADEEHLHELGGVDTIVDLVSVAALLDRLAPERIAASPPALGNGLVRTAHGLVPVPAPAVCALLTGVPTAGGQGELGGPPLGELTTPTGAALLSHFAADVGALPAGRILRTAYGAGRRDVHDRPNVLRALLVEPDAVAADASYPPAGHPGGSTVPDHVLLETNIDDMTAELLAHAAEALRAAGASDVWFTQVVMKKGRPGVVLHVLAREADGRRLAELVFRETSTFGLRVTPVARVYADERVETVLIQGEPVGVRLGFVGGRLATVSPEYEDVRRLAAATGRPAGAVDELARALARDAFGAEGTPPATC